MHHRSWKIYLKVYLVFKYVYYKVIPFELYLLGAYLVQRFPEDLEEQFWNYKLSRALSLIRRGGLDSFIEGGSYCRVLDVFFVVHL